MNAEAELVATLLDAGLDPNAAGLVTGPPLHSALMCESWPAADAQRLATVEALLARGANAAWRDGNGNNLLVLGAPARRRWWNG